MVYKPRRERRARGGKAAETEPLHPEKFNQYNAAGSPEEKEEHAASDGFKRGGRAKRKEGGHVEGHAAKHHLGRRARGGAAHHEKHEGHEEREERKHGGRAEHHEKEGEHMAHRARGGHVRGKHARGGAPFSHAHSLSAPGNDKKTGPGESAETIP